MPERIDITLLVDNSIDVFIPSTEHATYPVSGKCSQLWAEQGLSLLIEVSNQGRRSALLYDFGRSKEVLLRNAGILGLDFGHLDYLVLSHGHVDHYTCLLPVLEKTRDDCRLFLHPEADAGRRFVRRTDGTTAGPWRMDEAIFKTFGSRIASSTGPETILEGVHLSGQISRVTAFEPGMPNALIEKNGTLVHDPIPDDQSVILELGSDRLVVVTGCCHSGVVNTLEQVREQFPGKKISALLGGLHLNSAGERQMNETMDYIAETGLEHLAAFHCTGYYAQRRLMDRFREAWLPATVGAKYTFTAP